MLRCICVQILVVMLLVSGCAASDNRPEVAQMQSEYFLLEPVPGIRAEPYLLAKLHKDNGVPAALVSQITATHLVEIPAITSQHPRRTALRALPDNPSVIRQVAHQGAMYSREVQKPQTAAFGLQMYCAMASSITPESPLRTSLSSLALRRFYSVPDSSTACTIYVIGLT